MARTDSRSQSTRTALMRSATRLIAARGIGRVSIREIVTDSGQKNESALQYHFGSLEGLIDAIRQARTADIQARRAELLDEVLHETPSPSLRALAKLMVQPAFDLARTSVDFRRYVQAFGQEMALGAESALTRASRTGAGGDSGALLETLLRRELDHLDEQAYRRRMDQAIRLCAAAMYTQAARKQAFRGPQGDLFFLSLIDALVGLMSAPESAETRAVRDQLEHD